MNEPRGTESKTMTAPATPMQRRVADLESEAFQAARRHDEVVTQLGEIQEAQGQHAVAIAAALQDTRDLRADMRDVKASLARLEALTGAIVTHLGIEVPAAAE